MTQTLLPAIRQAMANGAKVVEGVGRGNLVIDLNGSEPRITSEGGALLSRNEGR